MSKKKKKNALPIEFIAWLGFVLMGVFQCAFTIMANGGLIASTAFKLGLVAGISVLALGYVMWLKHFRLPFYVVPGLVMGGIPIVHAGAIDQDLAIKLLVCLVVGFGLAKGIFFSLKTASVEKQARIYTKADTEINSGLIPHEATEDFKAFVEMAMDGLDEKEMNDKAFQVTTTVYLYGVMSYFIEKYDGAPSDDHEDTMIQMLYGFSGSSEDATDMAKTSVPHLETSTGSGIFIRGERDAMSLHERNMKPVFMKQLYDKKLAQA